MRLAVANFILTILISVMAGASADPLLPEFTFQDLAAAMTRDHVNSIEGAIDHLPPEMKADNYILMYRSRSLQEASTQAPRAILFTPNATFIATFNGGEPGTRGAQTLETIQFNAQENRFEFREITFDGVHAPVVSETNPAKCLECHQSPARADVDPRPNWEPYSTWTGAFGSNDGNIFTLSLRDSLAEKGKPILPQDAEVLDEQTHEEDFLNDYKASIAPTHSRYSKLGHQTLRAPVIFTDRINGLNFRRVIRLFESDPDARSLYRETFAWMVSCQAPIFSAENSPALNWLGSFQYPQYYDYPLPGQQSISSRMTQLFEPVGLDTSDWSMDFGTGGRFAFIERFGTPYITVIDLHDAWKIVSADAADLSTQSCQDLESASLQKMNAAFTDGTLQRLHDTKTKAAPSAQKIVARCISCHADPGEGSGIPRIPFDQPALLATMFSNPAQTHPRSLWGEIQYRVSDMAEQSDQMPPGRRLSLTERTVLLDYLQNP